MKATIAQNMRKGTARNLLLIEHLNGVVPAHTAIRRAAADEDDLGLTLIGIHGRGGRYGSLGYGLGRGGDEGAAAEGEGGRAGGGEEHGYGDLLEEHCGG